MLISKLACHCPMRFADALVDGGDGFAGESSAAQIQERRRRIMGRENCRGFECLSPRSLISRWLSESKGRKIVEVRSQKVERETRREVVRERNEEERCSTNGLSGNGQFSSCVSELKGESGLSRVSAAQCTKEDSFNLAVGFGLFYLLAASKSELNKMVELRTEMELLLQNAKEEFRNQSREIVLKPSESNEIHACSTTDTQESLSSNGRVSLQSLLSKYPADSETTELCDQSITCKASRQEKCMEGIDQLEAELEAELERLQLHLDTGDTFENPKQERLEVTVEDLIDHQEAGTEEHFGVPPNELERRLHELLESRQQERINELEAALERVNQMLCEKEKEVSWWKDTARLVSKHVTNTSPLIQ
ncbi:protein POLAR LOCALIZATION DURING ASYMMETRIC DIVISION AND REDISTRIBUTION-like isoform X2 [Actinidia eriantha]|uniref:protein POLAR LOCALIZATION DURING ASYMMETRIC DIVISION AND REDISTRIBUTION-like isoform X2 n=1 Tax=Actinidia eriantha TaxID=165200 RepID=UPI0025882F9D|nr:protein POLAR LOCALIZATION DURING ASYMMETRIC DIVISION AND REDISTRIBUTION-like isoform X2 [Actinidia eriantha]